MRVELEWVLNEDRRILFNPEHPYPLPPKEKKRMPYDWIFPLATPQNGLPLGNREMGVLVWGEERTLRITLGRMDCWDHKGGWGVEQRDTYEKHKEYILSGNTVPYYQETRQLKENTFASTNLPMGRFELDLGEGANLKGGRVFYAEGRAEISFTKGEQEFALNLFCDPDQALFFLEGDFEFIQAVKCIPCWDHEEVREGSGGLPGLKERGYQAPHYFEEQQIFGWVQERLVDEPFCIAGKREGHRFCCTALCGTSEKPPQNTAVSLLMQADAPASFRKSQTWWQQAWANVPEITIPNKELESFYYIEMYKYLIATHPEGVPCTLQGPWINDDRMVPYFGGYVFDLNVWMIYLPGLQGNCNDHYRPLFSMLKSWMPTLQTYAKNYYGLDEAVHLPQKVNDRCRNLNPVPCNRLDVGGMAGWVATIMFKYYQYSMDTNFLRETAYVFMKKAMRVYEHVLERRGKAFFLPVARSPEYRDGPQGEMLWGENPSFHLALIHRLGRDLIEASELLGETAKPIWTEILENLPLATVEKDGAYDRISILKGQAYDYSHRHLAHMQGLFPFDTLDLDDPYWKTVVRHSMDKMLEVGPLYWASYSFSWMSILHTRMGDADAAELNVDLFNRFFKNKGGGTQVFTATPGLLPSTSNYFDADIEAHTLDGGMGALTAIQQMLLHSRNGVQYIFHGTPERWRTASFKDMKSEGAFLISSEKKEGQILYIKIKSPKGGLLKIKNPWGQNVLLKDGNNGPKISLGSENILKIQTQENQVWVLLPDQGTSATAKERNAS